MVVDDFFRGFCPFWKSTEFSLPHFPLPFHISIGLRRTVVTFVTLRYERAWFVLLAVGRVKKTAPGKYFFEKLTVLRVFFFPLFFSSCIAQRTVAVRPVYATVPGGLGEIFSVVISPNRIYFDKSRIKSTTIYTHDHLYPGSRYDW